MHFMSAAKGINGKLKQKAMYKKLHNFVKGLRGPKVSGLGDLGCSHSILQKACLNFLPNWCRSHIELNEGGIVLKYFEKKYDLNQLVGKKLDTFLNSLRRCLQSSVGKTFDDRGLENILCKAF